MLFRRTPELLTAQEYFDLAPRVKVVFGRWYEAGPGAYAFGFLWDKVRVPEPGYCIWQSRWLVRITIDIRFWISRS